MNCENTKKFIRNGAKPLPKDVCVETKISEYELTDSDQSILTEPQLLKRQQHDDVVILDVPRKNFSKCIENRINKVENLEVRKIKSYTDLSRVERTTYNEKITKNVLNFPFDKKLYKELISLQLSNDKPCGPVLQTISTNHEPTIRDKVPKLEDFYVPLRQGEFNIPVMSTLGSHTIIRNYDGLRMHKVMYVWKNENYS